MSVFWPTRRTTGPDGRRWEIYAYRIDLSGRPRGLRNALRLLRHVAAAAARSLRSDTWTIEAVTWLPAKESFVWSTTREYRGQVLAQIEGNFARGDIPQHLGHATYLGWRRSER